MQVVGGEDIESLAVDGEHPSGQEAGIEREQTSWIGHRRLDVAAPIAHDEGVAIDDLHEVRRHGRLLVPAASDCADSRGSNEKIRSNRSSNAGSPSGINAPRNSAAMAFARPLKTSSSVDVSPVI